MIWLKQQDGSYAYYTVESANKGVPFAIARQIGSRWQRIIGDECVSFRTFTEIKRSMSEQK